MTDIGHLYDEESYRQNALFVSCCIKDDKKAMEMTMFLINECNCDPTLEDQLQQTCVFYQARDGREEFSRLFL